MQKGRGRIDLWYTVLLISANGITREFEFTNFCVFEDYSIWSFWWKSRRGDDERRAGEPDSGNLSILKQDFLDEDCTLENLKNVKHVHLFTNDMHTQI